MPGIETGIWAKYKGAAFYFAAVNVGTNVLYANRVYETEHLTLPLAFDLEEQAFSAYRQLDGVSPLFPLNVLVGKDGRVLRVISDALDFAALDADIAAALAK